MSNTLVQNYAKAFWGTLSHHPESKTLISAFTEIGEAFKSEDTVAFFSSPVFSVDQKMKVIDGVFKDKIPADLYVQLKLLAEKDRLSFLPRISEAVVSLKNETLGIKQGNVFSPIELSSDEISKIEVLIGSKIASKVSLKLKIDEQIKAGVRVEVDGWTFDDGLDYHELKLTEYLKRS